MSNDSDLLLMMKDVPVLRINFNTSVYDVLEEKLIPFQLKNKLREVPDFSTVKTRYEDTQRQVAIINNRDAITNWLAGRVLPISRDNAKKIYNLFGFSQQQNDRSKSRLLLHAAPYQYKITIG